MKRLNPAEKLSDVLDLIHARHYNGLLSVERFQSGCFEEGEIYFEKGRPIYAHSNQKLGKEAFSRLANWRQIYFAFDKDAPNPEQAIPLPPPSSIGEPDWPWQPSSSGVLPWNTLPRLRSIAGLPFSDIERLVPHKLVVNQNVLALPLTRAQRAIYLLVDGKRTIADLARCIGKSIQDIRKLLNELQEQGLILV